MNKLKSTTALAALSLGIAAAAASGADAATMTFSNATGATTAPITSGTFLQTVTSTLTGNIVDVDVTVEGIATTWSSDLEFSISSPDATSVDLMSDLFGAADWSGQTLTFDDDAPTSITASSAGVGGTFRPENALSALNGGSANGLWTFNFTDDAGGDVSSITGWSVTITDDISVVPVPASLPLLLGGLGAFGVMRSRRKKSRST